jgi:DNA-binding GntR family transcriptional regulator
MHPIDITTENTTAKRSSLNQLAYQLIRESIMSGSFQPGQKLSTRKIAMSVGIGLTPVREALVRLVAERALEATHQRSARISVLTKARVHQIMQLRCMLEGHAAEQAAQHATPEEIEQLRRISLEIMTARHRNDRRLDIRKIYEFHFALYRCARLPDLIPLIESLWLRTGPYLNLLFPDYTRDKFGEGRGRMISGLQERDGVVVRQEVEKDIRGALTFIAEHFSSAEPA